MSQVDERSLEKSVQRISEFKFFFIEIDLKFHLEYDLNEP